MQLNDIQGWRNGLPKALIEALSVSMGPPHRRLDAMHIFWLEKLFSTKANFMENASEDSQKRLYVFSREGNFLIII